MAVGEEGVVGEEEEGDEDGWLFRSKPSRALRGVLRK